jgi:hypothetical protein
MTNLPSAFARAYRAGNCPIRRSCADFWQSSTVTLHVCWAGWYLGLIEQWQLSFGAELAR